MLTNEANALNKTIQTYEQTHKRHTFHIEKTATQQLLEELTESKRSIRAEHTE